MTGSPCWRAVIVLAPSRQRSLAAAVQWSYQLLAEEERRVFRLVSVIPGPFTLQAAEAVAGPGAGQAVLHLVDCSLLVPPRAGPDGRARYVMLETLRAFGLERLAEADEHAGAAAALAQYALQAASGLQTRYGRAGRRPVAGRRGCHRASGPDLGRGPRPGRRAGPGGRAGSVVVPAGPLGRGRRAAPPGGPACAAGGQEWCAGQLWLGHLAAAGAVDHAAALGHFTLACDALAACPPSPCWLTPWQAGQGFCGIWAAGPRPPRDARRALAMASELGYPAGRAAALIQLALLEIYREKPRPAWTGCGRHSRLTRRASPAGSPGSATR